MGLGGCYSCIKYLMFAFNFLFWLLGCAILGVGIWVLVDKNFSSYVDSSDTFNYLYTGAYILIAVGLIVMIIGFLGCCGAIRESQCMLAIFFIFLFLIFALLLAAGIWAIVAKETYHDALKDSVTDTLKKAVSEYHNPKTQSAKTLMDNVQDNFDCCGAAVGATDYVSLPSILNLGTKTAPSSCKPENYLKPCDDKLFAYFAENMVIIGGVAIGIGVVMLLGMIFSMMLCCAIREAVA